MEISESMAAGGASILLVCDAVGVPLADTKAAKYGV